MKKIKWLLVITVITTGIISLPSCQSTKTTTASKMLKFNFEKGKGYDYEMITSVDQEIMGKTMQMDMSAYYSMEVNDDDGKTKTISSTVDRFRLKMEVMGFTIDVDTDKPLPSFGKTEDGKDPMKMLNALFGAIKGQKFTMKVDAEGKIQEVTGFENMAKTIVDSMGVEESKKEGMMTQFNDQFNSKKMISQFERAWYIFPNKEVKVGDSWEKNSAAGEGGTFHSTYKVTDIEGDMVTLSENTKIEVMEEGKAMKGSITGTIVVDSRLGLVVTSDQETKMNTDVKGKSFEVKAKTKIKGKAR